MGPKKNVIHLDWNYFLRNLFYTQVQKILSHYSFINVSIFQTEVMVITIFAEFVG